MMITKERAFSLAAAAMGDSLRVLEQTGGYKAFTEEVREARDLILKLRDECNDRSVPQPRRRR